MDEAIAEVMAESIPAMESTQSLESMTVVQLKTKARSQGYRGIAIDFYTKTQLLKLLSNTSPKPETVEATEAATPQKPDGLADILAHALEGRLTSTVDMPKVQALIDERFKLFESKLEKTIETEEDTVGEDIKKLQVDIKGLYGYQQTLTAGVNKRIDESLTKIENAVKADLEEMRKRATVQVKITTVDGKTVDMGVQHKSFSDLLKACSVNLTPGKMINVWLVGPAGTGKTMAAGKVAEALEMPFYFNGAIDSEYKLRGFVDAQGRIVSTQFTKAYRDGGVYLFDEADSSLPPALLAFNAALANSHFDFPEGIVKRHPKFICIAAANTFGMGANAEYVGRMKQDAAFLDRFVFIEWNIDEALERALAGNDYWVDYVQGVRARAVATGLRAVISPRASIFGATLLAAGFTQEKVIAMTVRKSLTDEQWKRVK